MSIQQPKIKLISRKDEIKLLRRKIFIFSIPIIALITLVTFFLVSKYAFQRIMMNPQVNFMIGDCQYRPNADSVWEKAVTGLKISKEFEFKTGSNAYLDLLIQDQCVIRIKENSYLVLHDINPDIIKIQMTNGVLFGKIHRMLKGQDLNIISPTITASIRGTEFSTEIINGSATGFCVDGKVEISSLNNKIMIEKYSKTIVNDPSAPLKTEKMTPAEIKRIEAEIASMNLDKMLLMTNNLLFEPGKYEVNSAMQIELDKIFDTLVNVEGVIQIVGHTDNTSGADFNQNLSQKRAEAIMNYFISKGMKPENLQAKGMGDTRPVFSNATAEGRVQNRRVEFVVLQKD